MRQKQRKRPEFGILGVGWENVRDGTMDICGIPVPFGEEKDGASELWPWGSSA